MVTLRKNAPLKSKLSRLVLPVLVIVILAVIVIPSPTRIINDARTTTPPYATITVRVPPIRVHITNTWAGYYGFIYMPEIINDAEFLSINQSILLAGDAITLGPTYIILDPIWARGRSTLYGGPAVLIQVGDYRIQSAQGLYYNPGEGLYIAGYVQKTKEDPPHALVMSVNPFTGDVLWATVLNVFNASEGLDLTMVHQQGEKYLAVVGWARLGTEKDALLMKVKAASGEVLETYLIGRPGVDEEATAVATNDVYEFITINSHSGQNVTEPLVLMTDWENFVDAYRFTSIPDASMGYLNDIEYLKLPDATETVVVVGTDYTKSLGFISMLYFTTTGMNMLWGSIEVVPNGSLVYNGITAYTSTLNEPDGELVIAGTLRNATSGRLQAMFTERGLLNSLRSFVTLYSDGQTEAVEAFAEGADVEYHWIGGTAFQFSPFNDPNPFAGRIGEQFALPLNLEWVSCRPRPEAKYVEVIPSIKQVQFGDHINITITKDGIAYIQPGAQRALREQQECVAYPYTYFWWLTRTEMITLTVTRTEVVVHNLTVTQTALLTEVTETTITCTNEVTTTRIEETTVTHTTTETYTQTLTATEEKWATYASLGMGALSLIFILAVLAKVLRT